MSMNPITREVNIAGKVIKFEFNKYAKQAKEGHTNSKQNKGSNQATYASDKGQRHLSEGLNIHRAPWARKSLHLKVIQQLMWHQGTFPAASRRSAG